MPGLPDSKWSPPFPSCFSFPVCLCVFVCVGVCVGVCVCVFLCFGVYVFLCVVGLCVFLELLGG